MATDSWTDFRRTAIQCPQRIILADGEDKRVVQAAILLQTETIAHPLLVGRTDTIQSLWDMQGGKRLGKAPILDPFQLASADHDLACQTYLSLPKNRTLTRPEAVLRLQDSLILGCLWLKLGRADGFVGGARRTTSDTLRAIFTIIGLEPKVSTLFGLFLIGTNPAPERPPQIIILADCAVIPEPSARQLAHIAIGAAHAYQFFLKQTPRVALLSFSTLGSAEHEKVMNVRAAVEQARIKAPNIIFEGEWQADTALDTFTADIKGAGASPMAGQANVLIVPDLNCGNIAYKLVQQLGRCRAVGPILWGTAQPANDLSRGCSINDIVDAVVLTSLQAQRHHAD